MGVCINILGIPLIGDRECADKFRDDRLQRNKQNNEEHVAIVTEKQEGRSDRTEDRQEGRSDRAYARASDVNGTVGENIVGSISGLLGDVAGPVLGLIGGGPLTGIAGALSGLFGGGETAATVPSTGPSPLLLAGGALAVAAVVYVAMDDK